MYFQRFTPIEDLKEIIIGLSSYQVTKIGTFLTMEEEHKLVDDHMLSFMDAYSGYNHIQMDPLDALRPPSCQIMETITTISCPSTSKKLALTPTTHGHHVL